MNSQDIHNLQEAYMEVVQNQQLNELSVNKMLAYVKKGEKKRDRLNKKWDQGTATHKERMTVLGSEEGERIASDKVLKKTGKRPYEMNALDRIRYALTKEEYDLYDIILSHLLDEGYAETPEAAEAIMVNMGEDWREDIVEGYKERPVKKMKKKAMKIVDDPEYDGEPETVWRHQQMLRHATRSARSREAAKRKSQKNVDKYWEKEDR